MDWKSAGTASHPALTHRTHKLPDSFMCGLGLGLGLGCFLLTCGCRCLAGIGISHRRGLTVGHLGGTA